MTGQKMVIYSVPSTRTMERKRASSVYQVISARCLEGFLCGLRKHKRTARQLMVRARLHPCAATIVVRIATACRTVFGAAHTREQEAAEEEEEEAERRRVSD